jgi:hypothetical protein
MAIAARSMRIFIPLLPVETVVRHPRRALDNGSVVVQVKGDSTTSGNITTVREGGASGH